MSVTRRGSIFDGTLKLKIAEAARRAEEKIADETASLVRDVIQSRATHRTGRYERAVKSNRRGDSTAVTDGGIVYGNWLEGTSSRNNQTRFKGYHQFRTAKQIIERRATEMTRAEVRRAIGGR